MKSLIIFMVSLHFSSAFSAETSAEASTLLRLDEKTGNAEQILIRQEGAMKIYDSLISKGGKEIVEKGESSVAAEGFTCYKWYSNDGNKGQPTKVLCSMGVTPRKEITKSVDCVNPTKDAINNLSNNAKVMEKVIPEDASDAAKAKSK